MGLLKDLLSRDGRSERVIARSIKKALNKDSQSADRMVGLEKLRDTALEGDEEAARDATVGLFRRLELVIPDKSIDDEAEKEWAYDVIVRDLGKRALPALEKAILAAESISWHLKILAQLADDAEHWRILEKLLERNEPGYERDPTRKIQLVGHLGELKDSRAPAALLPYLEDHDETVRFVTVEALLRHRDEPTSREPLLRALLRPEEESRRIKVRIAEVFAETGWTVEGYRGQVEKALPTEFFIDAKGHIKRKGTA